MLEGIVDESLETECWEWKGLSREGYGNMAEARSYEEGLDAKGGWPESHMETYYPTTQL